MATAAQAPTTPPTPDPVDRYLAQRAATNRANSLHSTGPRTEPGKQRSSLNALRHRLTARTAVLPTEDPKPTSATSSNLSTSTNPPPPPKLNWSTKSPTPPGASTASRSSKPNCSPKTPTPNPKSRSSPRLDCTARGSPANSKKPSINSATSRKNAAAWSAASSPKPPKSSYAISAKNLPGSRQTMASFFQNNKSSSTHAN